MVQATIRMESCSQYHVSTSWGVGRGGGTHSDRILDLDVLPPVSSEATPVCNIPQHGAIWVLLLAVDNREGKLKGRFRVACKCDVVRFTAAHFDTCQGVPSLCAAKRLFSG